MRFGTALRAVLALLVVTAVAAAAVASLVALNLRTYSRLTYEQPVLSVEFQALAPQRFAATVTRTGSPASQRFELAGDEWMVDARVLKWHGFANVLGLDARYRLERISGRYRDLDRERTAPRSVYSLHEEPFFDFWAFAQAHSAWIPFVDGFYGSATYLPMANGARYQVTLSQTGLLARPDNDAAREVSQGWK
jgi:hypothetical protein